MDRLQKLKQAASADLLLFGKLIAPKLFRVESPEMHRELSRLALDQRIRRLCVKAPRGSAKTTLLATLLPLHQMIYSDRMELIVIVSATNDGASQTLDAIKTIATDPLTRAVYGELGGPRSSKTWTDEEATFLGDRCMVKTRGLNQQIRGLHYRNQRPTLIILDDPDDEDTAKSLTLLESHWKRLQKELLPALDPQRGRIIVIGTPVHELCIVERLQRDPSWTYRHFKALLEVEGADPSWPASQRYVSYWPQWHRTSVLIRDMEQAKREGRLSEWWSEYMCELIGDQSAPFQESMLRYWEGELVRIEGMPHVKGTLYEPDGECEVFEACTVTMGVDPASSVSGHADFTAIVVLAQGESGRYFIIDSLRLKAKPIEAASQIISLYDRYRPERVLVETQGYQEMLRGYLKEKRPSMPVIGMKAAPGTRKETRLLGLQPDFAQNRFYMHMERDNALREELLLFPRAAHDDLLDALYYAWRGSFPPAHQTIRDEKTASQRKHSVHYNWMTL